MSKVLERDKTNNNFLCPFNILEKCDGGFKCTMGPCLLSYWQCDGDSDCPDGSDENRTHCSKYSQWGRMDSQELVNIIMFKLTNLTELIMVLLLIWYMQWKTFYACITPLQKYDVGWRFIKLVRFI